MGVMAVYDKLKRKMKLCFPHVRLRVAKVLRHNNLSRVLCG